MTALEQMPCERLQVSARDGLEEVLAAHVRLTYCDKPFACSCEPGVIDARGSFSAHLAEKIRDGAYPTGQGCEVCT